MINLLILLEYESYILIRIYKVNVVATCKLADSWNKLYNNWFLNTIQICEQFIISPHILFNSNCWASTFNWIYDVLSRLTTIWASSNNYLYACDLADSYHNMRVCRNSVHFCNLCYHISSIWYRCCYSDVSVYRRMLRD